jgi:hypothetical protein
MEILFDTQQASEFLESRSGQSFPATTLGQWRFRKIGPKWITIGRRVFYREADLIEFLRGTVHHTRDSLRMTGGAADTAA